MAKVAGSGQASAQARGREREVHITLVSADSAAEAAVREAVRLHQHGWSLRVFPNPQSLLDTLPPAVAGGAPFSRYPCPGAPSSALAAPKSDAGGFGNPHSDVLLIDAGLKAPGWPELVERVANRLAEWRVILVAKSGDVQGVFRAVGAGASGYVVAPFSAADIAQVIQGSGGPGVSLCHRAAAMVSERLMGPGSGGTGSALSPREREVIACLVEKLRWKEIGERLGVKTSTALTYQKRLFKKLAVHSRQDAVRRAFGGGRPGNRGEW